MVSFSGSVLNENLNPVESEGFEASVSLFSWLNEKEKPHFDSFSLSAAGLNTNPDVEGSFASSDGLVSFLESLPEV